VVQCNGEKQNLNHFNSATPAPHLPSLEKIRQPVHEIS